MLQTNKLKMHQRLIEMINLLNNQKIKLIKTDENELSYEILANDDKS